LLFVEKVKRDEFNETKKLINKKEQNENKINYLMPKNIRFCLKSTFINILVDHKLNENFKFLSVSKNFRMRSNDIEIQINLKRVSYVILQNSF
jgi:hypothetical protein